MRNGSFERDSRSLILYEKNVIFLHSNKPGGVRVSTVGLYRSGLQAELF